MHMIFNISPLVLISNNVLYFGIERFGACLVVLQLLLTAHHVFSRLGSIDCALGLPVKNHVVNDTLSGTSSL